MYLSVVGRVGCVVVLRHSGRLWGTAAAAVVGARHTASCFADLGCRTEHLVGTPFAAVRGRGNIKVFNSVHRRCITPKESRKSSPEKWAEIFTNKYVFLD